MNSSSSHHRHILIKHMFHHPLRIHLNGLSVRTLCCDMNDAAGSSPACCMQGWRWRLGVHTSTGCFGSRRAVCYSGRGESVKGVTNQHIAYLHVQYLVSLSLLYMTTTNYKKKMRATISKHNDITDPICWGDFIVRYCCFQIRSWAS